MLIAKDSVTKALQLSTGDVVRALERAGYKDNKISCAEFKGMSTHGHFVYETEYINLNTGVSTIGKVYISFDNFGKMIADY